MLVANLVLWRGIVHTDMFHTLSEHHLVKDLSSAHPNKPVTHESVYFEMKSGMGASGGTYDSSISGCFAFCNGCTSFRRVASALNAGLGMSRVCL
jgi:hypothetical protein